ncbi:hypothetical protein OC25_23845 [Pedobacter kyungheensis]|uniref:Uncharacterized protein n=1 Tax=Pedobacter kyungheensis TaxID=1069985 RepID=A0A0C1DAF2_9SPHI|nr:hypothetical protein [Pedobacter kyungheensis]KIA90935.1 hypothetical protein OC25_23845 [Pedobacter kyungheensis]
MNFSYEELYHMYGQYDTLITITFQYNSEAYKIFGSTLMGDIIYTEDERNELEGLLKENPVPRTDRKIRVLPSSVIKITQEQYERAERYGFLASDIYEIMSYNKPRQNNFVAKEKKEIQNTIVISTKSNRRELNQILFGFLNARVKRNTPLSPEEKYKFLGLARHFGEDITVDPYKQFNDNESAIRYHELNTKLTDLTIEGDDIKDYAKLISERYDEREKLIKLEIEKSGGKIEAIAKKYGDEVKNLKSAAHGFEEEIILFGEKLVFLDLERFLHIYARHVEETHVGDGFGEKTIFQYKYDDILRIIKAVVESESDAIQEHFKTKPNRNFVRMGKRSIYYEGHYYRVDIEPTGRLLTFHPYNNNEERDADGEGQD